MQELETLAKAASLILDESTGVYTLDIPPKGKLEEILFKLKLRRTKKLTFKIKPILVGNRYRIASKAVKFPKEILTNGVSGLVMEGSISLTDDMIYIAAVGLQNDRNEPSPELLDALRWLDDEALAEIHDRTLAQIKVHAFIKSIILIAGQDILSKMSPEVTGETIAPGE